MSPPPTISTAMARADAAHAKIESHEELCAERYGNIHSALNDLKKLVWGVILGVAAFGLATLVGVLLRASRLA